VETGTKRNLGRDRGGRKRGLRLKWPIALIAWTILCWSSGAAVEVPVVSAGLGPCTADFVVTDGAHKPLYDAKIHMTFKYGFMNKRQQDLEVGTNSDGKARFEGLPAKLKKVKVLEFRIRAGDHAKLVTEDPEINCHATFNVDLAAPQ